MTEDFLHYLWKFQKFDQSRLSTSSGKLLEILAAGYHNHNAGPDFSEAKIKIDGQLWAGQVEIHIRSSDWFRHGHQKDPLYTQGVILHVVYEHDQPVLRPDQSTIPTLILAGRFDEYLYWRYEQLVQNKDFIACSSQVGRVDAFIKSQVLERSLAERLQRKSKVLQAILIQCGNNWEDAFYHYLAFGYGLKVNTEPMLMLARLVPLSAVRRIGNQSQSLEALFLGAGGFLEKPADDYSLELQREFKHFRSKYELSPLPIKIFKYARLRPPAFPDFRIACLAACLRENSRIFRQILEFEEVTQLPALFQAQATEYWHYHYRLGKASPRHQKRLGKTAINLLLINVVVPFLYLYGLQKSESRYREKAINLLDSIEAERNKITQPFEQMGFRNASAFDSQGILEHYQSYCSAKKCLNCGIGNTLLKST